MPEVRMQVTILKARNIVHCSDCGCRLRQENSKPINGAPYCEACHSRMIRVFGAIPVVAS